MIRKKDKETIDDNEGEEEDCCQRDEKKKKKRKNEPNEISNPIWKHQRTVWKERFPIPCFKNN